jgi:glycosyltransferase involved in cell wall biosynthesis
MKIAYLLGSLNRGGTETLMLDVFKNALRCGLDVLCVYRKSGVLEDDFYSSGVQLRHIPSSGNPIPYLKQLRSYLLQQKVQVVHAQQPLDALYARLACVGTGIKVLLTFHGYDYTDSGLGKQLLRYIIRRTDLNLYVSAVQQQYYTRKYRLKPAKQQLLYNGISFEKLDTHRIDTRSATLSRAPGSDENLRNELQLSTDTLLMGMVGNFNDVRDQYTICRFLALLEKEGIDFHFVFAGKRVAGQEQLYDRCVEYCRENGLEKKVSFLGVRNDVPLILQQLDAFVYSTDHDTFGIAVVEAMAVGLPVFVNDWEVMKEVTDNGQLATLYKSKDETDLLREFMLFLQDKAAYQIKAKEAAVVVRTKYSIEEHIRGLKIVYSITDWEYQSKNKMKQKKY